MLRKALYDYAKADLHLPRPFFEGPKRFLGRFYLEMRYPIDAEFRSGRSLINSGISAGVSIVEKRQGIIRVSIATEITLRKQGGSAINRCGLLARVYVPHWLTSDNP